MNDINYNYIKDNTRKTYNLTVWDLDDGQKNKLIEIIELMMKE